MELSLVVEELFPSHRNQLPLPETVSELELNQWNHHQDRI